MIASRPALFPLIGLCAALAACSGKADKLSDAELARMLHTEGLADERVDGPAVDCLRAWAGDDSLASGLEPALVSEPGKSDCRRHMQAWLDDGSRNPQGLMFVDVATPKVTRRAIGLLAALPALPVTTAVTPEASIPAPEAPMPVVTSSTPAQVSPEIAEAAYQERVQINNTTNQSIDQYENACHEAQALVGTEQFDSAELQIINQCAKKLIAFRKQLSNVIANGNAFDVSMATRGAKQQLAVLRSLIERKKKR